MFKYALFFFVILFFSINSTYAFSINKIWDEMISKNQLYGCKSEGKFTHLTDIEIYNKLTKI